MLTFLNATSLRMAKEMTFTAQPVDAARAERHGMINYVVPAPDLEAFTVNRRPIGTRARRPKGTHLCSC